MNPVLDRITAALRDQLSNLVVMEAVDSTHSMALRLMQQMDDEGLDLAPTMILAGAQSQGQGRGERRWTSPPDGLYFNWLRSGLDSGQVAQLPMLAAASAHAALAGTGVTEAVIKWPNDLLVDRAKVAGILSHARHGDTVWATVGLGLNLVTAPELAAEAAAATTSLERLLGPGESAARAARFAQLFVAGLHSALDQPQEALQQWRHALVHRVGDELSLRLASGESVRGQYLGVTDEGFLRLDSSEGERVLTGGDITERP